MKPIIAFVLLGTTTLAMGQVTPFELGVGYGQSGRFDRDSGGRGRLEGPEISLTQAIASFPSAGRAEIGASVLFGGGLSHGSDTDGNVLRLFARYRTPSLGAGGLYLLVGGHWAAGKGRGGSFDEASRAGTDFGVGMPIGPSLPVAPKLSAELVSHQNKRAQLKGWSLTLKFRL